MLALLQGEGKVGGSGACVAAREIAFQAALQCSVPPVEAASKTLFLRGIFLCLQER